ncbi:hypothetical protein T265_03053 [Opisthorchis viverrini]|uniref:Uncharacterized protein n=1 Tax=Opisthorchis viverrini TaxID=6198 RepID=A0A075AHW2_OPIVI|nr:hypothetical protein T265_03053 [Opisthorchis viverrini]KER30579.1 hypothetical protein T265_03053 [Opisthorchis viverrini]
MLLILWGLLMNNPGERLSTCNYPVVEQDQSGAVSDRFQEDERTALQALRTMVVLVKMQIHLVNAALGCQMATGHR